MPIYEFDCAACGAVFERWQKYSDPDPDVCPSCGATGPRRRISATTFHLKGSGWYTTDYARKPAPKEGAAPGEGGASAGGADKGAGAAATPAAEAGAPATKDTPAAAPSSPAGAPKAAATRSPGTVAS